MTYWVVSNNFQNEYPTISIHYTRKEARKVKKAMKKIKSFLYDTDPKMFKLIEVR